MYPIVTNAEKKSFLEWFLQKYELQKRESAWLLTYIMSDEKLLEKVRFSDEVSLSIRSIVMSTTCVKGTPFKFRKGKVMTTDVEKAFHDIRLHPQEDIVIKLTFKNSHLCPKYASVMEDIPVENKQMSTSSVNSLFAEMILDEALETFEKERLYKQIDQALMDGDKELFLQLTNKLNQLMCDKIEC